MKRTEDTCRHCDRRIVYEEGYWVDPEATGDDSIWRETCDAHDTFQAEHEPTPNDPSATLTTGDQQEIEDFALRCPPGHKVADKHGTLSYTPEDED